MKICLITPPCLDLYRSLWHSVARSPPLGLAYIASILKTEKHDLEIIDTFALKYSWQKINEILKTNQSLIFGITCLTSTLREVIYLTKLIKKFHPNSIILIGGSHPTAVQGEILKEYDTIDLAVIGEGEYTTLELVRIIKEKYNSKLKFHQQNVVFYNTLRNIHGLVFRNENSEIITNSPRGFIQNLDELPIPAYELLPMEKYRSSAKIPLMKPFAAILTARGCPYQCTFCAAEIVCGNIVRKRSIENVNKEIILLSELYHVKQLEIYDSTFTIDKKRAIQIGILFYKKKLKWFCNGRVNEVDLNLLKIMAKLGCILIEYGFEAADLRILKSIQKNITIQQIKNAVIWTKIAKILVSGAFMIGNIGENRSTIQKSFQLSRKLDIDFFSLAMFTPYPGTKAYQKAVAEKLIVKPFIEYRSPKHSDPVINLPDISSKQLKIIWLNGILRFYFRVKYIRTIIKDMSQNWRILLIFPNLIYSFFNFL